MFRDFEDTEVNGKVNVRVFPLSLPWETRAFPDDERKRGTENSSAGEKKNDGYEHATVRIDNIPRGFSLAIQERLSSATRSNYLLQRSRMCMYGV